MSARENKVKVRLNDQELARLDEMRGDEERAVYLRRLLHQPQRAPYRLVPARSSGSSPDSTKPPR